MKYICLRRLRSAGRCAESLGGVSRRFSGPSNDNMLCINGCEQLFTLHPIDSDPLRRDIYKSCKMGERCESKTRGHSPEKGSDTQWCWCCCRPNISSTHPSFCFRPLRSPPQHLPVHQQPPAQLKRKLWHFKDYLCLSSAAEPSPPSSSPFFFSISFEMMQISTNLYRCIHKYPASSENVHVEKKKKKKNQRPFKKGNRNIISIFSFRCLNWHEEYNQISLLTVTHMLLQEREKYHLPAYISCQDGFLLLLLFLFLFFFGRSVFIMVPLFKL